MTTSTSGRSSPLAATSVARSIEGEEEVHTDSAKELRVRVRTAGERCPCREYNFVLAERNKGSIWNSTRLSTTERR